MKLINLNLSLSKLIILTFFVLNASGLKAGQNGTALDYISNDIQYAKKGADACIKCHDEPRILIILETSHAQSFDLRTPFASHQCESCHGPSPEHFVNPEKGNKRAPTKVVFGPKSNTPALIQNKVCLGCHKGEKRMHWKGSQHQRADVLCISCHTIHTSKDPVLAGKSQSTVCYKCHTEQKVESVRRSRHPIREGKVSCSDCHNAHGSFGPQLLIKNSLNNTCYICHPEKRGPFLWEHAPVRENCGICHNPHGSTQRWLLKVRTPYLCQMCHATVSHTNSLLSGNDRRVVSRGCLNCHSKVHGSNHPSGPRLLR